MIEPNPMASAVPTSPDHLDASYKGACNIQTPDGVQSVIVVFERRTHPQI